MSDGRQRLSGAEYRKRKREKEAVIKKQSNSIKKFLTGSSSSLNISNAVVVQPSEVVDSFSVIDATVPSETTVAKSSTENVISTDPAEWPLIINNDFKTLLVEKGPPAPLNANFVFPSDDQGRKFTQFHYKRSMSNGENVTRTWLVYSISNDVIFCFCCKLFDNSNSKLALEGYNDWRHCTQMLKGHETSKNHLTAYSTWLELSLRLKKTKTIDDVNQRILESECRHWNEVLQRIMSVVQFLGHQNLAFRGSSDQLFKHNNGNFLKLIELMAKYDSVMAEHVRRIINSKKNISHYLGKDIQNEMINLLAQSIKSRIVTMVSEAKYYSIILDCTPDISHSELMTIIIRFVSIEDSKVTIREHFLGFISVENSTGENLCDVLLNILRELNIPLSNMRGQGYDNGANMKGVHSGVQRHIRNINPRAFFVPCSAHSLNLVVNDAAKSSKEAVAFFDIIQKVFNFFSASTIRWQILLKHVKELTLKPLSQTRWESRIDALKPFRNYIGEIYDALFEISENINLDPMVKHEAECLCNLIKTFKFICSVVIWYDILNHINPVNKLMQKPNFDISLALGILETLLKHLNELRSEESFEKMIIDSTALATEMGVESVFENSRDLQILLTDGDSTDINGIEMAHELKSVSAMVDDNLTPYELLTFVINAGDFAPNLSIALRILITLPVSVATGERSFSKLKLIKTYLRSTMKNERLCGLAMISIEHEVGQELTEKNRLIDATCYLAKQEFPFRGHDEQITSTNRGNYVELINLMGTLDLKLSGHLSTATVFSGLSGDIQNDLIQSISNVLMKKIALEIKNVDFVSIIMDETTDVVSKSQLSIIFRYMTYEEVQERFLTSVKIDLPNA
ncbi:zinc finger MYM-type protein 1-like [Rhopalosiphum maidis]|uniref:zinc finger MYM-type protein 1-like n=1 Tax=Rhopalosiphum maidis TaxID=43146 RepID=UPI000EFF26F0|nr:zinc finger MYM-type protein 1-like [Rhopalosiphum maidis]